MSRLVVVSNRVPDMTKPAAGGLTVGLTDAMKSRGGLWFGWNGSNDTSPGTGPTHVETDRVTTVAIPIPTDDFNDYYNGFSNSVLWPMFHYRLDIVNFQPNFLDGYKRINGLFADQLSSLLQPDDIVWIHDYHLIPLASELRKRGHNQRMGYFQHIPFAPADIVDAVPEHDWLISTLFSYDLIGFQTRADVSNFEQYITNFANGEKVTENHYKAYGQTVQAREFPIGIDVDEFEKMASTPESEELIRVLRQRTMNRQMIIGVDRLDYSKGLPDRLKAFQRLLELYPENMKKVSFMQIAPPTREDVEAYTDIREELESLSGAINGRFADFDWTPMRYIHRMVPREKLASLYRGSKVGFVSPLRDGMNLVAKEYVAAQDDEDPGVLLLSKFAGAAEEMEEALIVNPYDVDDMANNLQRGLRMNLDERRERQAALRKRIHQSDAHTWQKTFMDTLESLTVSM